MNQRRKYGRSFLMFPIFATLAALLLGAVVMWLWNAVLPSLLQVNAIRYWEAVGLLVLCRLLFGNFGSRAGRQGSWRNQAKNGVGQEDRPPRPSWRGKWMKMNAEERKQFRSEIRRRCNRPPEND